MQLEANAISSDGRCTKIFGFVGKPAVEVEGIGELTNVETTLSAGPFGLIASSIVVETSRGVNVGLVLLTVIIWSTGFGLD